MTQNNVRKLPTTTVSTIRCRVFQPTKRPSELRDDKFTTSWGTVVVNGKIGQCHADVLEAILVCAENPKLHTDENGQKYLTAIVDPYQIRKMAAQQSGSTLKAIYIDLMRAIVTLTVPAQGIRIYGHIIDQIIESGTMRHNPLNGGVRPMWMVKFAPAWTQLLIDDPSLFYAPADIATLRYGVSKAVARHVRSHANEPRGGWKLLEMLKAVGANGRPRDRVAELLEEADNLKKCGLEIDFIEMRIHKARS